jgi:hypothetical protein
MMRFLYGFEYDYDYDETNAGGGGGAAVCTATTTTCFVSPPMLFHLKLYRIAEKYGIPALKTRAKEKFAAAVQKSSSSGCWNEIDQFTQVVVEVYSNTGPDDHDLRDPILAVVGKHLDILLSKEGFIRLLEGEEGEAKAKAPGFATDLIRYLTTGCEKSSGCSFKFVDLFEPDVEKIKS